jgi:uncharacterized protein
LGSGSLARWSAARIADIKRIATMKFAEIEDPGTNLIEGYGAGHVRISGRDYARSVAVSAAEVRPDWGPDDVAGLSVAHLEGVLTADTQVLILGTGSRQRFPDPAVQFALLERGIGIEVMDTGAACRTYNILVSEGRAVVAALLLD